MTIDKGEHPAVSVVMNVYNGEECVEKTAQSILSQTCRDFEFIIVDDGSTDGTWEMLNTIAARDDRVILIRNENNEDIPAAINKGIAIARGRYIARTDADDVSLPERLQLQYAYLEEHPDAALVCANWLWIAGNGTAQPSRIPVEPCLTAWFLHFYNHLACQSAVMFRRDIALQVGGYDTRYPTAEDRALWLRMSDRGRLAVLPQHLVHFVRDHPRSVTVTRRREQGGYGVHLTRAVIHSLTGMDLSDGEIAWFDAFWPVYWKKPYPPVTHAPRLHAILSAAHRAFITQWSRRFPHESERADTLIRQHTAEAWGQWAQACAKDEASQLQEIAVQWKEAAMPALPR